MSFNIVDKRKNPSGKSLNNRKRFIERSKENLRKSVKDGLDGRSISSDDGQDVSIPVDSIHEPSFRNDHSTGDGDYVLPGNEEYVIGDIIEKPPNGGSGGGEGEASDSGEGSDGFDFQLTKDEYYDILFEDLELPNLEKTSKQKTESLKNARSGYSNNGNPSQLHLISTMRKSLGRRIALKFPTDKKIRDLKLLLDGEIDKKKRDQIIAEIEQLQGKSSSVPFIDPIDLRYRNYVQVPIPKHQAVMFCVMDVSASMGQAHKDLAKRFYLLLYLFLRKKYKVVDIIFIRHHSIATECTEEEFFYSKETGGTIVSEGFKLMKQIQEERYPENDWNIFVSQASDGDNFSTDNEELVRVLEEDVLPITQYFSYIEVCGTSNSSHYYGGRQSLDGLWSLYDGICENHTNMDMAYVSSPEEIYPVFRKLFSKEVEA